MSVSTQEIQNVLKAKRDALQPMVIHALLYHTTPEKTICSQNTHVWLTAMKRRPREEGE